MVKKNHALFFVGILGLMATSAFVRTSISSAESDAIAPAPVATSSAQPPVMMLAPNTTFATSPLGTAPTANTAAPAVAPVPPIVNAPVVTPAPPQTQIPVPTMRTDGEAPDAAPSVAKPLDTKIEMPKAIVPETKQLPPIVPAVQNPSSEDGKKAEGSASSSTGESRQDSPASPSFPTQAAPAIAPVREASAMAPVGTSTAASIELQDTVLKAETVQTTVADSKDRLLKIVDQRISDVIKAKGLSDEATSTAALKSIRDGIRNDLNAGLTPDAVAAPDKIKELGAKINDSMDQIGKIASSTLEGPGQPVPSPADAVRAIQSVVATIGDTADAMKASGADLLYKDSNGDGISDYDSVHLYNIDPIKPSPVTVVDGKPLKAGDKIALGYDPSKADLVKVVPEQPRETAAPVALAYKVTDVKLAPDTKKLVLQGQALPNSFVTLYIYSTPITVVVKTDSNGQWSYTLDKELDSGEHTIYTASVNDSGKIIARSSGFAFTKTAEAATLDTVPAGSVQPASDAAQPTVLESNNVYVIIVAFLAIVLVAIGLIGVTVK